MDPDTRVKVVLLLLLIGALGLLGITMLTVLIAAWKRFNARNRAAHDPDTRPDTPAIDAWQLSGKRLTGDAPPAPSQEDDLLLNDDLDLNDPLIRDNDDDEYSDDEDDEPPSDDFDEDDFDDRDDEDRPA